MNISKGLDLRQFELHKIGCEIHRASTVGTRDSTTLRINPRQIIPETFRDKPK